MSRRSALLMLGLLLAGGVAGALEDPTRPPGLPPPAAAAAAPPPHYQLTSILIAQQRRIAVVNGRQVQVGDRVDGARVEAIAPDRVTLRKGERPIELSLFLLRVKEPKAEQP